MKKFTNNTIGPKGINTKAGTVWIEPGKTVEIDADSIIGKIPDLGKKADAVQSDTGELEALQHQVADLTKQVETLKGEKAALESSNADLTKQVETLTKPADTKK